MTEETKNGPGAAGAAGRSNAGQHDNDLEERHRRRTMVLATAVVVVLLAGMVWVVQMFVAQQKLERCLATGRKDCLQIEAPPRNGAAGQDTTRSNGG